MPAEESDKGIKNEAKRRRNGLGEGKKRGRVSECYVWVELWAVQVSPFPSVELLRL